MSWRTIYVTGIVKLELKLGFLVVRGETTNRISLSEIGTVIIESTSAAITTGLLNELSRRKIKIIFCDEKHNPYAELVDYYGTTDASGRLREQINWSETAKIAVWTDIVKAKIHAQSAFLKSISNPAHSLLDVYLSEVQPGDSTNREAHAAKVYFNALFGESFSRQSSRPPNPALNYGYSILLSTFNKEIVASGYSTKLGIFHNNKQNPFNLSSDFMEPYRPLVDFVAHSFGDADLSRDHKLKLINLMNKKVIIDGTQQRLNNAIRIYCASLFRALTNNNVKQIAHYQWPDLCDS